MDEQGHEPEESAGKPLPGEQKPKRHYGLQPGTEIGKEHRFQPGVSGNPSGRPKNSGSITTQLRKHLTHAKASRIAKELVRQAEGKGDNGTARDALAAAGIVLDRTDGPLNQVTVHRIEYRKVIVVGTPDELPSFLETERAIVAKPVAALSSADASQAVRDIEGSGIHEALPVPEVPEFDEPEVEVEEFMPRRDDGHRQVQAGDVEHRTDEDSGMTSISRAWRRGGGLPLSQPNKPDAAEFTPDGL